MNADIKYLHNADVKLQVINVSASLWAHLFTSEKDKFVIF